MVREEEACENRQVEHRGRVRNERHRDDSVADAQRGSYNGVLVDGIEGISWLDGTIALIKLYRGIYLRRR